MQNKILSAAVAALLAFGGSVGHAEPLKIKVGWIVVPSTWAPILFEKKELLKHYGTSYVVEPVHFQGTPLMITAIATGDLDVADLAFSSFATAIINGHMDDLRVITAAKGRALEDVSVVASNSSTQENMKQKKAVTPTPLAINGRKIRMKNRGKE